MCRAKWVLKCAGGISRMEYSRSIGRYQTLINILMFVLGTRMAFASMFFQDQVIWSRRWLLIFFRPAAGLHRGALVLNCQAAGSKHA